MAQPRVALADDPRRMLVCAICLNGNAPVSGNCFGWFRVGVPILVDCDQTLHWYGNFLLSFACDLDVLRAQISGDLSGALDRGRILDPCLDCASGRRSLDLGGKSTRRRQHEGGVVRRNVPIGSHCVEQLASFPFPTHELPEFSFHSQIKSSAHEKSHWHCSEKVREHYFFSNFFNSVANALE
jgi:hypothetical protein